MRTNIELPTVKIKVQDGQLGSANIQGRLEIPETVPSADSHVEFIYDLDESMEVVRRHFSLSDFEVELARRYPMLRLLEIDVHYRFEWEDMIEPLFIELRSLRSSLKRGRMKAKLDRQYPMLNDLEIDACYGLNWEDMIEPLFRELRSLRTSLKKGRLKAKLDRVRWTVSFIEDSLVCPS
jgi:hypothetical protein